MNHLATNYQDAIGLLKELISTPSFSREEDQSAGVICRFLGLHRVEHSRTGNNVFAFNKHVDHTKPTILLNSHHDTVKPARGYTLDPFQPVEKDGRLYGLGSNDAGGALVSLIATFLHFHEQEGLPWNIALAATAEEEISGPGGIEALLQNPYFREPMHGKMPACAIVGEPTQMQLAVAERGLMVVDAIAHGRAGHAARNEGDNAISRAVEDIGWIQAHAFSRVSDLLGPTRMTVTVIETENKAHNVVPASCRFVVDVRVNEHYTFEEVLGEMRQHMQSELTPRSMRMRSTSIALDHPLVRAGVEMGRKPYGSPTTSDKALMPFPALKMGPGDSARSHTPDEYIFLEEVREGIRLYTDLLDRFFHQPA
ncbi:MAG: M20 family metallo-hydrolase [Chitinophagaceae bacterium]|nr:M20 family metallo-hydrolase [Chitinophagaceae bacterium]